ncbi:MAG: ATP-dependent Clp protease adapter ClpS [Bdellovibrionales bacterium]|nr:ATP-dependent Clp protease adapter ClpS [Bdellovibrionales bacterium]
MLRVKWLVSQSEESDGGSPDGKTLTRPKPTIKRPSLYKVLLLNDDFTPMDFVVQVLTKFFNKSQDEATRIMLEVHEKGRGVCGIFTREIAETKAARVVQFAQEHEHPLQARIEPV